MRNRILVVEDDEKSRRLLTDVLGFHGYAVDAFENGEAALEHAQASMPDVALLDIQLPGISGFEVLWSLRKFRATPHLPVLAVTASAMDQDRRKIVEAGFDFYVPKPVNMKELLAMLRTLLPETAP